MAASNRPAPAKPIAGSARPRPRVAYVRGYYLGRFELDYFRLVEPEFEFVAFTGFYNRYDLSDAPTRVVRLRSLEDGYMRFPGPVHKGFRFLAKHSGLESIYFGLEKALRDFDVVHAPESLFGCTVQMARLKQRLGYRLIVQQAEVYPFQRDASPLVRRMRSEVHAAADILAARTEAARAALILEGAPPEKIRVLGHGVDMSMFKPMPRDPEWSRRLGLRDEKVVLFIGRLVWEKGVYPLLHAACLLKREGTFRQPFRFVLIGRGPEEASLRRLARRLDIEDVVTFHPGAPFREMPQLMSVADLLTLPSIASRRHSEQFGHVLIEAMACGKPVVSASFGPMNEVVGDDAIVVPQNDGLSLAQGIRSVLESPRLAGELSERGLARVRARFAAEQVAGQARAIYREALGLPAGATEARPQLETEPPFSLQPSR